MSVCAPEGFRLALAASLVPLDEAASLDALHELSSRSLVEEIDRDLRRCRLHALVRETADGRRFGEQHAEAVNKQFENWETDWRKCQLDLPDFQVALTWALADSEEPLTFPADRLAINGFRLNYRTGHLAEALEICERMSRAAEQRKHRDWLLAWFGNQAVILKASGRLEEALELLKKVEALCLELGNRAGLGYCYLNWGLLARIQHDSKTEHEKLSTALALFTELKMAIERDGVAAELAELGSAGAS